MEKIKEAMEVISELEEKYDLTADNIREIREQADDFKVYIPLIGRFSAGKSALINNLIGFGELCREDIGVATAIPTEVFYGEEDVAWIFKPEKTRLTMDEYMEISDDISAENATVVKLQISDNDTLSKFPSIALVDLPGLDSGYEVHDRAIRDYIRKSMAYILVFPADELIIPGSMEPILRDLNTYDIPMCVVITKGNRIGELQKDERKEYLRNSLKKYFGEKSIEILITEKEDGYIKELVDYLERMQGGASEIGFKFYKKRIEPEFARITNYLEGYLKKMSLSQSELEEEKDHIKSDIVKLSNTVDNELSNFNSNIPSLVNQIAMDVQAALSSRIEDYVYDIVHDTDPRTSMLELVRSTVTNSYQKRVGESIRKYLDRIADALSLGSTNYASAMVIDIDKICGQEISDIGMIAIDVLGLILGGPISGVLVHLIAGWINKYNSERRREKENQVRAEIFSKVFPAIDREVRDKLEKDLRHVSMEINTTVKKDVALQVEALQKSLNEVLLKKAEEDKVKEEKRSEIETERRRIEEIRLYLAEKERVVKN